jgi:hypothetical protein
MWNKMIEFFPLFAEVGKDTYLNRSLDWLSNLKLIAIAALDIPDPIHADDCYLCDEYRDNLCDGCPLDNPDCFEIGSLFHQLIRLPITDKEAILVLMKQIADVEIPVNED